MTTDVAALVALGVFLVGSLAVSVLRAGLHRRRTGFHGIHVEYLAHTHGRWVLAVQAMALLLCCLGPLLTLFDVLTPLPTPAVVPWLGLLLAIVGFACVAVGQQAMGTSWRIGVRGDERTALVTTGAFAVIRNPIYTALLVALAGLALLVPTILAVPMLACALVAIEIQVRAVEEPHLLRAHGAAYLAYARTTGRFLPGIGRSVGATREHPS